MISLAAEHALHAIVYMAGQYGPNRKVAESHGVPAGYLANSVLSLAQAGAVKSKCGLDGEFALVGEPEELSILAVIKAVNRLCRFAEHPLDVGGHGVNLCSLHRGLNQTALLVEEVFGTAKVSSLILPLTVDLDDAKRQFPTASSAAY
jgi:Rrf2 family protein